MEGYHIEDDKYEVKVVFVCEIQGDFKEVVLAVFPEEIYAFDVKVVTCYAHIGQHSGCHLEYCRSNCRTATPEEYKGLMEELISIGYELEILDSLEKYYQERL